MPLRPHRSYSLRSYLYLGLGSIAAAFALTVVGLRTYMQNRLQEQAETQMRSLSRTRAQQALLLVLLDEEVGLRSYLGTGGILFLESYDKSAHDEDDAIRATLDNIPEGEQPKAQDRIDRMRFLISQWHGNVVRPLIRARLQGPLPDLKASLVDEKDHFDAIRQASDSLASYLDGLDEKRLQKMDEDLNLARAVSGFIYAAVVLCGLYLTRWLHLRVANPLSDLAEQARAGDGFPDIWDHQPIKEVEILGRSLHELDIQNRERQEVLRKDHDEALATRAFAELAQHLSREEDLLLALEQALARLLHATRVRILLRPAVGDGLVSSLPTMPPEEAEGHPVMVQANLCRAIHQGAPVGLPSSAPTACICPLGVPGSGAYLCIPLVASGQTVGLVNLQAANPGHWTPERQRIAETLASTAAVAMQAIRALDLARERSIRDALTGAYNRRFLDELLPKIGDQAIRSGLPLSLLMLDIDHFKSFNDEFGHGGGDAVLKAFAACLQANVRGGDIVTRFGGEEFAILLPNAGPNIAASLAERLRMKVHDLPLPEPQFPHGRHITASIGVATYPDHSSSPETLLHLADQALYEAKGSGRNRIISAEDLGKNLTV